METTDEYGGVVMVSAEPALKIPRSAIAIDMPDKFLYYQYHFRVKNSRLEHRKLECPKQLINIRIIQ